MAPVAFYADYESVPATRVARVKLGRRQPLHVLLELAALVEAEHFFSPADVSAADEDPRKHQFRLLREAQDPLQLVREPGVHRQIAFVDRNTECAQDRSDGLAVFECGPNHPQTCEVHYYSFLRTGYTNFRSGLFVFLLLRLCRRRVFDKRELRKAADEGLKAAGAVANGRLSGGIERIVAVVGEENVDVLEG